MKEEIKEILELYKNDDIEYYNLVSDLGYDKLLDHITNLQEEIKEYEELLNIQNNRKYAKKYLEERRKEHPNLLYPDYDEIYKRYYEQKDKIKQLQEENERLKEANSKNN